MEPIFFGKELLGKTVTIMVFYGKFGENWRKEDQKISVKFEN